MQVHTPDRQQCDSPTHHRRCKTPSVLFYPQGVPYHTHSSKQYTRGLQLQSASHPYPLLQQTLPFALPHKMPPRQYSENTAEKFL